MIGCNMLLANKVHKQGMTLLADSKVRKQKPQHKWLHSFYMQPYKLQQWYGKCCILTAAYVGIMNGCVKQCSTCILC